MRRIRKTKPFKKSKPAKWLKPAPLVKRFTPGMMHLDGKSVKVGSSKIESQWLDQLGVPRRQVVFRGFNNKLYVVDGLNPETKTCFEFLGDKFHGCPRHTDHKRYNTMTRKTYGQMYYETLARFNYLTQMGWKVFFVWECDYNKGNLGRYYLGPGDQL